MGVDVELRECTKKIYAVPGVKSNVNDNRENEIIKVLHITLPRDASFQLLKQSVAEQMGWDKDTKKMAVYEIWHQKIYRLYSDWDRVAEISGRF
jgi:hypothetical protein